MKSMHARRLALLSTVVVAGLAAGASGASAQTLLDVLFGNRERRVQRVMPPEAVAPPPREVPRAAAPRVSGPQYYTYKTDPLVRVDFAAIAPATSDRRADADAGIDGGSVASVAMPVEEPLVVVAQASTGADVLSDALVEGVVPDQAEIEEGAPETTVGAQDAAGQGPLADDPLADALVEGVAEQPAEIAAPAAEEPATASPEPSIVPAPEEAVVAPEPQPLTAGTVAALQEFELLAEQEAAEAIVAHYSAVPEFIWVAEGGVSERGREALKVLADAGSHGLDPADYLVAAPASADERELARFEMELSARLLRYVRDARSGRIDPNRISGYHDFAPKPLDMVATLQLARAGDVAGMLEGQHPQNRYYRALRAELETLRASAENDIVIAPRTLIKPGETNPEFAKIIALISRDASEAFRTEHGALLDAHAGSQTYVRELVPVIKAAQAAAGQSDDGVIGPRTIQALAGDSKANRIARVEVALEQIRWLPSDLGERYVFLNTPSFTASYFEGGAEKLSMRAIYGNNSTQTYFFQDEIQYVEFHPYWGVPRSILVNKYLPKLYDDPGYLDRSGFEVVNSRGQMVSSSSVEWWRYGSNPPYDVRQRPGRSNALGELKIMFPNKHAIYMHDTPDKHLFDRDNRALSNGCVRLQDPRAMAAAVLGWDRERVTARLDQPHSREDLEVKVPVYVAYFTAWPGEDGTVAYHGDIYDRDTRTRDALQRIAGLRAPSI
jgi:murein L,D-transpeptidase YcbB/YkuD